MKQEKTAILVSSFRPQISISDNFADRVVAGNAAGNAAGEGSRRGEGRLSKP